MWIMAPYQKWPKKMPSALTLPLHMWNIYRPDSKVSLNPNFCVGCFELIISKNFAAASKMGKNGQKLFFL